jgi:hypothetical protein
LEGAQAPHGRLPRRSGADSTAYRFAEAFRVLVDAGNAASKLHLKRLIARRSVTTRRSDGSYDTQIPTQETEPDLGTAKIRAKEILVRLAAARSEIEGRVVTPALLIAREIGMAEDVDAAVVKLHAAAAAKEKKRQP